VPKNFSKIASMREIVTKHCGYTKCGKVIMGLKIKLYCDESCKQHAKRERKENKGCKAGDLR
jgi:hypothetical protein